MKKDTVSMALVASTVLISSYLYIDVGGDIFIPMFMPIAGIALRHYLVGVQDPVDDDYISPQGANSAILVVLGVLAIGMGGLLGKNLLSTIEGLSVVGAGLYVTLIAIGEEQFFRGFLYEWLRNLVKHPTFAILGSALIFMVYHSWIYGGDLSTMGYVFVAGVVLAYVCQLTNRLWPACFIHIIVNLLSVGAQ